MTDAISLSLWEDDEFIVEINGNPVGNTVTADQGIMIVSWLKSDTKEIASELGEAVNND